MILQTIPAITIAFMVTLAFMFALRPLARHAGLVDRPGGRKAHIGEVPVMGGLAMFFGAFAGLWILLGGSPQFVAALMGSFFLVSIGVLDDKFALPAGVRIATQFTVVLIMIFGAGLSLNSIGNPFGLGEIKLGIFSLPFTVIVTLTMINAYNLVDGVDGLAGSLALIALISLASVSGYHSVFSNAALVVAAVVTGFLFFNFPVVWNRPIRSFMGDAGSTMLGFTIVWITLGLVSEPGTAVSPVACLWFAAVPIFDCLTCFVRRSIRGRSPLSPGRDHFHHMLKRGGFGVRQVLAILTGLQLIYAIVALIAIALGVADVVLFVAWSVLGLSQRAVIKKIASRKRLRSERRIRSLNVSG